MQTTIYPANEKSIAYAARVLASGGLVAFPTETVYGLGANALSAEAVAKIFRAKRRPADNPLIVHIAEMAVLADIASEVRPVARKLMDAFWPGPLTLVLPRTPAVPDIVTAGLDTVAVRMPSHPVALELIRRAAVPVAAPSANASGRPSTTTAAHVYEDLRGRVACILDAGACQVGVESTVLDVTGDTPVLLRPGGIPLESLEEVCGKIEIASGVTAPLAEGEDARSPGMKHTHYAPRAPLILFDGPANAVAARICREYDAADALGLRPAILCMRANRDLYGQRVCTVLGDTSDQAARALFAALRTQDSAGAGRLLCEVLPQEGIGRAVMNRLQRASGFRCVRIPEEDSRPESSQNPTPQEP